MANDPTKSVSWWPVGVESMGGGFGKGEDGVGGGGIVHEEGGAGRHMMFGVLV